jgi:ParB/RepB/Spo0J family partition protein
MDEFRFLPLGQLVDPPVVLRLVNRASVAYLELRDSLAHYGPLNSICVRPSLRFPGKYDVADGLYRVTAAREIALPGFPSVIKDLTDDDLLAIQIQANAVRPETTPMEYARQIRRIVDSRPGIRDYELVGIIHKSPGWIRDTLGLENLRKDFQPAVERGEMPLGSAYELARIPYKHQADFFDAARTMPVAEFRAMAQAFLKQFQEAVRQGKLDAFFNEDFKPVAHMRPLKDVLPEYENPEQAALLLAAESCKTPLEAWRIALAWVMHLDRGSIETQREAVMNRNRKPPKEVPDKQP